MFQYMTKNVFNSSIINTYCYKICLLWSNFAVLWNLWVFFSKHFLFTQEKFTSKFVCLSQLYKCGDWQTISKQANLSVISRNLKITWSSWHLVVAFFETSNLYNIFYCIVTGYGFLLMGDIHTQIASRNVNLMTKVVGWFFFYLRCLAITW